MIRRHRAAAGIALALAAVLAWADPPAKPETDTDRLSYSLGVQIGRDLHAQGIGVAEASLRRGVEDGLADRQPALTPREMQRHLSQVKHEIREEQQRKRIEKLNARREEAERRRRDGAAFMAQNATKAGVVQTPSGLQYRVIEKGEGRQPTLSDRVRVAYRGMLVDGTVFDLSDGNEQAPPPVFAVNRVVRGWTEALQMMHEGDRWELVIPPELAYGRRGPLADRTLVFDVELVAIEPPVPASPAAASAEGGTPDAAGATESTPQ